MEPEAAVVEGAVEDDGFDPVCEEHLPEVPEDFRKHWEPVERRVKDPQRLAAMRWWMGGATTKDAARMVGIAADRVKSDLLRYGIRRKLSTTERIVSLHKEIAHAAEMEQLRRLHTAPEQIKDRDLTIMSGVSTDKIATRESWGKHRSDGQEYVSALEKLAERALEGKIRMEIRVEPADASPPADSGAVRQPDALPEEAES